jgi:predicted RNA-binding Zn ribbon-like protein
VTEGLSLIEAFLNTADERTFSRHGQPQVPSDQLVSAESLAAWFAEHGLAVEKDLRVSDLDTALSLRAALRAALIDVESETDGGRDDTGSITDANRNTGVDTNRAVGVLSRLPLHLALDGTTGQLRLRGNTGVSGLDRIIETVAVNVADGSWARLKLCAAPDCRWAFYDTSRNAGGRWCRMEACGNRNKTRAYRRRQTV